MTLTLTPSRAAGRVGGQRKKLDAGKRREIAESVVAGRKSGADMARLSRRCRSRRRSAPGLECRCCFAARLDDLGQW